MQTSRCSLSLRLPAKNRNNLSGVAGRNGAPTRRRGDFIAPSAGVSVITALQEGNYRGVVPHAAKTSQLKPCT